MDNKQIRELMAAMERAGIKKMSLKEKSGFELMLERYDEHSHGFHHEVAHARFAPPSPHPAPSQPPLRAAHQHEESAKPREEGPVEGSYVTSPMVGTFYAASSPEEPPLIKIGDLVEEGTLLCIIEAMKVMNEVKAGVRGKVVEVCVENGHPVEFGTKLFRIV